MRIAGKRIVLFLPLLLLATLGNADDGKAVFDKTCKMCHGAGIVGAPKFGDKEAWKNRIAQDLAVLQEHALKGFKGDKGAMPPKGGNPKLSDDEVKAAVKYMVDAAQ